MPNVHGSATIRSKHNALAIGRPSRPTVVDSIVGEINLVAAINSDRLNLRVPIHARRMRFLADRRLTATGRQPTSALPW